MKADFYVPKQSVPVEVVFAHSTEPLTLYLSEHAETHTGYERLTDLLGTGSRFVPATRPDGGFVAFNRDAVFCVTADIRFQIHPDALDAEILESAHTTQIDVRATLRNGTVWEGRLSYVHPRAQNRLHDILNLDERFLVLRDGDRVCLLNKERVERVTPLSD